MIVRDQLGRDHAAATDIQSAWRGKSAVNAYKKYRSARTIQAAWRGKFAHIEYMVYLAEILAATLIQSAWRGFVGHTDYILTMSDIVIAQKMARRLLACKKITSMRVERAALNIQRSFRGHKGRSNAKDRRAYLENERVCQKAVTDIQRSWRGHDQRQQYWLTLDCVVRIQSIMRGKFVRDQLGKEQFAATKIQAIARGRSAHSAYIVFLAEQLAAVMIQSLWRGFVCYTDYIFTLGDVLTVQKMVRKYLACKKMSAIRQEKAKLDSAIAIQRTWRGHFEQQRYWYLLGCTIQLQRAVRGAMIRDRLAVEHAAAIKIQTAVRQWQTIARFRRTRLAIMSLAAMGTLNESQKAIRKIETWYLTESRSKKTREEEAAVCLQNWWIRQSLAEKLQIHAMEQFAAVIIQRWWRFVLFYQCDKEDAAATAIQVWWRLWKARMTRKKLISERDQAACTIQHFFLMVKAMVDREIRAEKRRRKRKKMYKKFHTPEMEEALLETIWTNTVETPRTSHKSIPFSRSTSRRTSSRSVPRPQQENIPTKSCPRNSRISRRLSLLASEVSKDLFEDASVMSHHTEGSSVYHVAPSSRSKLTQKDLDEDNALEEAWIDTEINFLAEKGRTSSKQRRSSSKQRRSSRGAV
jgi:myosin heavy subunit